MVKKSNMTLVGYPEQQYTVSNVKECVKMHKSRVPWAIRYDKASKTCTSLSNIRKTATENTKTGESYFLMPENANCCFKTDLENCQAIKEAFRCPDGFQEQATYDSSDTKNCFGVFDYRESCPGDSFLAIITIDNRAENTFVDELIQKYDDERFRIGLELAPPDKATTSMKWSWIDGSKLLDGPFYVFRNKANPAENTEVYIDKTKYGRWVLGPKTSTATKQICQLKVHCGTD